MAITKASEHSVSGLSSLRYCDVDDVLLLMRKVSMDTARQTLGAWLAASDRDRLISLYVMGSRRWIDERANRDFDYHNGVAIEVDGSGLDALNLAQLGFTPLISVSNLTVSGSDIDEDDYKVYPAGLLKFNQSVQREYLSQRKVPFFDLGTQNVTMTATWGFSAPPDDIRLAHARKVIADVLADLQTADSEEGELPGGVRQVRYGDLTITSGDEGRFASYISRMERLARQTCFSYRKPRISTLRPTPVGARAVPSRIYYTG